MGGRVMTTQAVEKTEGEATLVVDGKSVKLPVVRGSEAELAVDVQQLRGKTGFITLDRGYPIEELAEKSSFLEVAWLLIHGELPTQAQLSSFADEVTRHTMLHENFRRFFE